MTRLNDLESLLLSGASRRDDLLMEAAAHTDIEPGRLTKTIEALVRKGLVSTESIPDPDLDAADGATLTRHSITDKGLAAIGVDAGGENERQESTPPAAPSPTPAAPRESKTALLISLLARPVGATLDQMVAATSWLPHTTRAALTGLKKKGYVVTSEKVDGVRTYRITAQVAA